MKCEVCGYGPEEGLSIFRVNPKGVTGIWRCREHLAPGHKIDAVVEDIVSTIEGHATPPPQAPREEKP